jgi:hypothetical protein
MKTRFQKETNTWTITLKTKFQNPYTKPFFHNIKLNTQALGRLVRSHISRGYTYLTNIKGTLGPESYNSRKQESNLNLKTNL